jgi:hypothetical protein
MKEVLSARYKEHGPWLNTKPPSVRHDKLSCDYGCARRAVAIQSST